jgi:membrane protease YdiL (CAAX protease family)
MAAPVVAAPALALVVVAAAALPTTRPLFTDRRLAGVGPAGTAYRATVRIPLGTVLLEEVAFRGVLLALFAAIVPPGLAVAATSALFGLWHVVPTATALEINGVAGGRTVLVIATVVGMAVGGAVLCWLRLATGGLAAPAAIHTGATATATVAAYLVQRRTAAQPGTHLT